MRTIEVYCDNMHAGQLREVSRQQYEFVYTAEYLSDNTKPPISVNLPKRQEVFKSNKIFPFFTNLLLEGGNRRALCRTRKVDEKDFFGMLEMICDMDCIGNVTLRKQTNV